MEPETRSATRVRAAPVGIPGRPGFPWHTQSVPICVSARDSCALIPATTQKRTAGKKATLGMVGYTGVTPVKTCSVTLSEFTRIDNME